MPLSQPVLAPEGHQLFLIFVDGGPQPPRPVTAWKLAAPGQDVTEADELSVHIDSMVRQGVHQRGELQVRAPLGYDHHHAW